MYFVQQCNFCYWHFTPNTLKLYNITNSQCIYYNVAIQRNCKQKQLRKLSLKLALKTAKAYVDTNKVQVNLPICHSQRMLISDNSKTLLCVCVYSKQPIINMKTSSPATVMTRTSGQQELSYPKGQFSRRRKKKPEQNFFIVMQLCHHLIHIKRSMFLEYCIFISV